MFGPALFGRLDPGPARRRRWITGFTLGVAALFLAMAVNPIAGFDVAAAIVVGLVSGYIVFQYADVKSAYPASMTGRAMAVFTMALFLGVALLQWFTGVVASAASADGGDPYLRRAGHHRSAAGGCRPGLPLAAARRCPAPPHGGQGRIRA